MVDSPHRVDGSRRLRSNDEEKASEVVSDSHDPVAVARDFKSPIASASCVCRVILSVLLDGTGGPSNSSGEGVEA